MSETKQRRVIKGSPLASHGKPTTVADPCWEIDRGPWECPHFPTRDAAEAERAEHLAEYGTEDGPVRQLPYICVVTGEEDEDGWLIHSVPLAPAFVDRAVSRG